MDALLTKIYHIFLRVFCYVHRQRQTTTEKKSATVSKPLYRISDPTFPLTSYYYSFAPSSKHELCIHNAMWPKGIAPNLYVWRPRALGSFTCQNLVQWQNLSTNIYIWESFFFHWTLLFSEVKFLEFECDILLDRVGHCREPHVFRFLICAFMSELWPQRFHSRWKE